MNRVLLHLLARKHFVLADLCRVFGVEVVAELDVAEKEDQQSCEDRQHSPQVGGLWEITGHLLEDVQITDSLLERHLLLTLPPSAQQLSIQKKKALFLLVDMLILDLVHGLSLFCVKVEGGSVWEKLNVVAQRFIICTKNNRMREEEKMNPR